MLYIYVVQLQLFFLGLLSPVDIFLLYLVFYHARTIIMFIIIITIKDYIKLFMNLLAHVWDTIFSGFHSSNPVRKIQSNLEVDLNKILDITDAGKLGIN